jgi:hypothetical protein
MGSSLCLNIAENAACTVAGFDLSDAKVPRARARAAAPARRDRCRPPAPPPGAARCASRAT